MCSWSTDRCTNTGWGRGGSQQECISFPLGILGHHKHQKIYCGTSRFSLFIYGYTRCQQPFQEHMNHMTLPASTADQSSKRCWSNGALPEARSHCSHLQLAAFTCPKVNFFLLGQAQQFERSRQTQFCFQQAATSPDPTHTCICVQVLLMMKFSFLYCYFFLFLSHYGPQW